MKSYIRWGVILVLLLLVVGCKESGPDDSKEVIGGSTKLEDTNIEKYVQNILRPYQTRSLDETDWVLLMFSRSRDVEQAADKLIDAKISREKAIRIAVNSWKTEYKYTQKDLEFHKPYNVIYDKGTWIIYGSLPEGWDGGVAYTQIDAVDGRILGKVYTK